MHWYGHTTDLMQILIRQGYEVALLMGRLEYMLCLC